MFRVKLENGTTFEVPDEVEAKGLEAIEAYMVSMGYPTKEQREKAAKDRAAKQEADAAKAAKVASIDTPSDKVVAQPTKES